MAHCMAKDAASATGCFDAEQIVDEAFATVRPQLIEIVASLRGSVTPAMLFHFESVVFTLLREFGRSLLEALFNSMEGDGSQLPNNMVLSGQVYRRLGKKTRYQHVATLLGRNVSMTLRQLPNEFIEAPS